MKQIPLRSVIWNFTKEWLLPKAGAAWAIYQVAKLGVTSAIGSSDPTEALKPYIEIIHKLGDWTHISIGIAIGILFLLVNIAKFVSLFWRPVRFWFKFSRLGSLANIGINIILGTLLLPMTLWLTAELQLPQENRSISYAIIIFVVYVVLNFITYWNKIDDSNDSSGAAFWSFQLKVNQTQSEVISSLQKHFADLIWIGDCEVLSNSKDGHLLVEMPILYDISKWSKNDLDKFQQLYKESTKVLKESGFEIISKSQSTAIKIHTTPFIIKAKSKR